MNAGAVMRRVGYAALFVVALPMALAWWATRLDAVVFLPIVGSRSGGWGLLLAGLLLMLAATRDLLRDGGAWPMSAYPPERLVRVGTYGILRDPIYVGAVLGVAGAAMLAASPAGIWIVTPVLALAATAWVLGFERSRTIARFGALPDPLVHLPASTDDAPMRHERLITATLLFGTWLLLYLAVERLGPPAWAPTAYLPGEAQWRVIPWTEAIYAATYPFVVLAPFLAPRRRDLRDFAIDGLLATGVAVAWYLLVPFVAPAKPIPGDGFWQDLMRWERQYDSPATALPAFHLVWALLAARLYVRRWPATRWLMALVVTAIAISCVTTGMHALLDLVAATLLFLAVQNRGTLWRRVRTATEALANSWREWAIGPIRILSHGAWAFVAAVVGLGATLWLAGMANLGPAISLMIASIVGAAIWAQVVEGSPQLLRPFGYFGSVLAAVGAAAVLEAGWGAGWLSLAALSVGGAVAQALGRGRCLVQGCCHGRPSSESVGIRYTHPRSRVVRLAGWSGVALHPTPLYSFGWMLLVAGVLLRLWYADVSPPFVVGCYFLLTGLGRFVEEHFRGEPQTREVAGLRLYQWLAILFVIVGAAVMTIPGEPLPRPAALGPEVIAILVSAGALSWAAYGVDLPHSRRRFSRLT